MLLAIEGIAGAGKSTLRDRLLTTAAEEGVRIGHVGQFSWLSLESTRIIIALRAGHMPVSEDAALAAVHRDLSLHARHNLAVARAAGHVIADRLVLSTACLLALLYHGPIDRYVRRLAATETARPEMTILLTTPAKVCIDRLLARQTARRFSEQPETAAHLAELHDKAASAWERLTGQAVLRHPSATPDDTDLLAAGCMTRLRAANIPNGPIPGA